MASSSSDCKTCGGGEDNNGCVDGSFCGMVSKKPTSSDCKTCGGGEEGCVNGSICGGDEPDEPLMTRIKDWTDPVSGTRVMVTHYGTGAMLTCIMDGGHSTGEVEYDTIEDAIKGFDRNVEKIKQDG
jgi:hypothetical protein